MGKMENKTKKELIEEINRLKNDSRENKIFGYCRVSTKKQMQGNGLEAQKEDILKAYPNAEIIFEQGSGQWKRPAFEAAIENCIAGDVFVCTKLDRFCRNTKEGLRYIDELLEKGVTIHILNMGTIDDTPIGKLTYTILLAFAEFEKSLIVDRMNEGKEVAKANNPDFKEGRHLKFSKQQLDHAMELLDKYTYNEVISMTGISRGTLWRERRKRNYLQNK